MKEIGCCFEGKVITKDYTRLGVIYQILFTDKNTLVFSRQGPFDPVGKYRPDYSSSQSPSATRRPR